MNARTLVLFFSGVCIGTLAILNGCLLKQNISYQSKNRELILKNDSLMAVAILLKQEMDKTRTDTLIIPSLHRSSFK